MLDKLQRYITSRIIELGVKKTDCSYDRGYDDGQLAAFQETLFFLRLRNDIRNNGKLIINRDETERPE
jgi:hypothetical protein